MEKTIKSAYAQKNMEKNKMKFGIMRNNTVFEMEKSGKDDSIEFRITDRKINLSDLDLIDFEIVDSTGDDPRKPREYYPAYRQIERKSEDLNADYAVMKSSNAITMHDPVLYYRKR